MSEALIGVNSVNDGQDRQVVQGDFQNPEGDSQWKFEIYHPFYLQKSCLSILGVRTEIKQKHGAEFSKRI